MYDITELEVEIIELVEVVLYDLTGDFISAEDFLSSFEE